MSHEEERVNGARIRNMPERAPPHWLNPFGIGGVLQDKPPMALGRAERNSQSPPNTIETPTSISARDHPIAAESLNSENHTQRWPVSNAQPSS